MNKNLNLKRILKLNELLSDKAGTKQTVVLNPEDSQELIDLDEDIVFDKKEWKVNEVFQNYINQLKKQNDISIEEKMLKIYEKICVDYVYDDNLVSWIEKVDDDVYTVPDWYARETDEKWDTNREEHNRRVCYELARVLAKSLIEITEDNNDYSIFINWNKELTHYSVVLACRDYSVTMDPDFFSNEIKDLTRLKTGLTIQGIELLRDSENKFGKALNKVNEGRIKSPIKNMDYEIDRMENDSFNMYDVLEESDKSEDIVYLQIVFKILKDKYKIDSQGAFEYMKKIADLKMGAEKRKKIWKRIDNNNNNNKVEIDGKVVRDSSRYIRCLLLIDGNTKYIIDVDEMVFRIFNEEEFEEGKFLRFNDIPKDRPMYDGR